MIYRFILTITKWVLASIAAILSTLLYVFLIVYFFLYITTYIWPEIHGSHDLGNGLYEIYFQTEKIIVLGSGFDGNVCIVGENLVPTMEDMLDSLGNVVEHVIDSNSNDECVIVKTLRVSIKTGCSSDSLYKFYIIDKTFDPQTITVQEIVNNHMAVFTDSLEFDRMRNQYNIHF